MKILFIASGNKYNKPSPVVQNQAESMQNFINLDFFLIKGKGILGYIRNILPLRQHIKTNKYDLVHSHYSLTAFVSTFSLLFFNKRIPHIVSLMGSDSKLNIFFRLIIKIFSVLFWDQTIVKSATISQELGINKVLVIPNGVELSKIKRLEQKHFPQRIQKSVLFLADPRRESKNIILARKAIALLEDIDLRFKVRYNIPHEEVLKEILETNVLLATSKWEGSPNIIKEAMACNCPVVSTNVGDVEWLFDKESGYFLTTFEPEDVAKKLKEALYFSKNQGKTNGRQRILELGLDSETITKKLISIYKDAIERN